MIVKDSPESSPAAVDDQLERAVEILADFSTVQGKDR
jgi:flavin-binding protein dodecin